MSVDLPLKNATQRRRTKRSGETSKAHPTAGAIPATTAADPENKGGGPKPLVRVIKKYPNRRLYDLESSSYVTLDFLKNLAVSGVSFRVMDALSGEDLTRSILLNIILEQESAGLPLFSEVSLLNMIRFYGYTSNHGHFGQMLENNMVALGNFYQRFHATQPASLFPLAAAATAPFLPAFPGFPDIPSSASPSPNILPTGAAEFPAASWIQSWFPTANASAVSDPDAASSAASMAAPPPAPARTQKKAPRKNPPEQYPQHQLHEPHALDAPLQKLNPTTKIQ